MPTEYEYFAVQSGLQAGTLSDHQYAYYAARSGLVAAATRTNLFINPIARFTLNEWFGYYFPFLDRVTTESNLDATAVKVTTAGNTTAEGVILYSAGGLNDTSYTVSIWAKGPAGLVLRIAGRTESPQQEHLANRDYTMTGGWVCMHTTYKTSGGPFGLLGLQAITTAPFPAIGTIFYLTDAMIEKSDQILSSFNGGKPYPLNVKYAWTGEAHNSTSTATPATVHVGSLTDHQLAFFKLQNNNTMHDLGWQRLTYYRTRAGDQTLGISAARATTFSIYNAAQKARLTKVTITAV